MNFNFKLPSRQRWLELIDIHASLLEKGYKTIPDSAKDPQEPIDTAILYYLNDEHWRAINIYKNWPKHNPELNNHPYSLPNLYFARAFEEFFDHDFKQTLRFFKYALYIYPWCMEIWNCLIQMYFLRYLEIENSINYQEIKSEIANYNKNNTERINKILPISTKEDRFSKFYKHQCLSFIRPQNIKYSSLLLQNTANEIELLYRRKHRLKKQLVSSEEITSLMFKFGGEVFLKFPINKNLPQNRITINDKLHIITINDITINTTKQSYVLFRKMFNQLYHDIFYAQNIDDIGICSINDLEEALKKSRDEGFWKPRTQETIYSAEYIRAIVKNLIDTIKLKSINDTIIKNFSGRGYKINNNPFLLQRP